MVLEEMGPKVIPTPVAGPVMNLDITAGSNAYWVVKQNTTINAVGEQQPFKQLLIILDISALATVTFGTGFRTAGALVGLLNKTVTFSFRSVNGKFVETNRYPIPLI
ncbi:hypothetical protein TA3x_004272 [Tundrisphaera sp. TA3]|uniref:hypothetical protein n=1 Tax=Tundrisphaera sp. TA3 TaxID=3435775 RepID=UPI003EB7E485